MSGTPAHLICPGMPGIVGMGGRFSLAAFMARQSNGLWLDTTLTSTTWQDTAGTIPADDIGEAIGRIDSRKASPAHSITQGSATLKPIRQTTGAKFDGTDDNWLTDYYAGAGANFIVALVAVPASIPVFQYICGANDASSNRFGLGFNADGTIGFAAGTTSPVTQKGTTDTRGQEVVIGLSSDGVALRGFVGTALEYSGNISGSLTTSRPLAFGCQNATGTPANFSSGSIKKLIAGREFLTLSRHLQIRNAFLAA